MHLISIYCLLIVWYLLSAEYKVGKKADTAPAIQELMLRSKTYVVKLVVECTLNIFEVLGSIHITNQPAQTNKTYLELERV